jgi:hypothetical protein
VALSAPQLKEHDGEHEVGPMRRFATAAKYLCEIIFIHFGAKGSGCAASSCFPEENI